MNVLLKALLRRLYYFNTFRKLKMQGRNIILSAGGVIISPEELEIGNNVFISRNFHIYAQQMTIGSNVMIGPNFVAECDNHVIDHVGVPMFEVTARDVAGITIGDDTWIGANVTVLKGVKIGEGCVIGAGSVVTKPLPPYTVCRGVPCRPCRPRFNLAQLEQHLPLVKSRFNFSEVVKQWRECNLKVE